MKWLVMLSLFVTFCISAKSCSVAERKMECHGRCSFSHVMSAAHIWASAAIVYEKSYEYFSTVLWDEICGDTYIKVYEYGEFHTFLGDYMRSLLDNASITEFRSHLNFILICGEKYIQHLMNRITDLDNNIGQGSLLRHFSTWLIISHDPLPCLNVTLDNVALINVELPELASVSSHVHETFTQRFDKEVCVKQVHTLLWKPAGREWSRVHPGDFSHDHLYPLLFPNTLKGLNGRQIILSTLEDMVTWNVHRRNTLPFQLEILERTIFLNLSRTGMTWVPFVQRKHVDGEIKYVGSGIEMVELLKARFNFSYVIVEPQDKEWGRELENGTWTGVIGMLQKQEADMCPVLYGMSKDRRDVVDFSTPLDATPFSAVYRRDSAHISPWSYLLTCFSWEVYVCGLASILWIVLLFRYIQTQTQTEKTSIASSVEVVFRVPFHQDVQKVPRRSAARIVLSIWCVFCLVMTAVYTGNLVAFTAVDKYNRPFTTLMELAEHDEYGVGAYEGTYIKESLTSSNCTTCKSLHQKMIKSATDGKYSSDELLRKKLAEEKFVLLVAKESEDVIRSMVCDVVVMKQKLFPVHSAFIFQRNSALRKLFDKQLAILKDSAMFDKLILKWTPAPLKCHTPDHQSWLKLDHLKTSFLACASGILAATVVLLVEKKYLRCITRGHHDLKQ